MICVSSCAIPKPYVTQARSYNEFREIVNSPPQYQWAYCGSDAKYHYFTQWRYGAMIFTVGQSSYLKRHKVLRSEIKVPNEFSVTKDQNSWHIYQLVGGDKEGRFTDDFLRGNDKIKPVL